MKKSEKENYLTILKLLFEFVDEQPVSKITLDFKKIELRKLLSFFDNHLLSCLLSLFFEKNPSYSGQFNERLIEKLADRKKIFLLRKNIFCERLGKIIKIFQLNGIEYLNIKGPILEELIYKYPAIRSFGDLDFLVKEPALLKLKKILINSGYENYSIRFQKAVGSKLGLTTYEKLKREINFIKTRKDSVIIDVHWRVLPNYSCSDQITFELFENLKEFIYNGESIMIPGNYIYFNYLLLNAFKHRYYNILYFYDLVLFRKKYLPDDKKLSKYLKKYNLLTQFKFILFIWNKIFDYKDPVFLKYSNNIFERKIFNQALSNILNKKFYPQNPIFYLLLSPTFRDKIKLIKSRLLPDYYDLIAHFGRNKKIDRTKYYFEKLCKIKNIF
ncbi:nucleotidyltransferase family protein [Candidatus Dependentiae bacterium]|nr:nucleotidyltransferase family protein [Candidatus Dependentiae bacterium]